MACYFKILLSKLKLTILQGADTFLKKEYTYLIIFVVFFALVVFAAVD